jgi:hypothetical protein
MMLTKAGLTLFAVLFGHQVSGLTVPAQTPSGAPPASRTAVPGGSGGSAMPIDEQYGSLLALAAQANDVYSVCVHLDARTHPDTRTSCDMTALYLVVAPGASAAAEILLEAGADPLAPNGGMTPLDLARDLGNLLLMLWLVHPRPRLPSA